MIKSREEQKFIENFLFNQSKIVESVWLGAKRNKKTNDFIWDDGFNEEIIYNNWAKLNNEPDYDCAEIIPSGQLKGKWIDGPCKKRNIFICEKMPNWDVSRLKKQVNDIKKDVDQLKETNSSNQSIGQLKREVDKLKNESYNTNQKVDALKKTSDQTISDVDDLNKGMNQIKKDTTEEIDNLKKLIHNLNIKTNELNTKSNEMRNELNNLKCNLVPVGFIYVQLPDQLSPKTIWPNVR